MFDDVKSLSQLVIRYNTEIKCHKKLQGLYWRGGIECAHCDSREAYRFSDKKRFKCKACRKIFTVVTGTLFEGSHVSLVKWFMAVYMATNHKRGINSCQLARDIDVTQKTAYYMIARIQQAFKNTAIKHMDMTVEGDVTLVGGKQKNKHYKKKQKITQGRNDETKIKVFGLLERESGNVISFKIPAESIEVLAPIYEKLISKDALLQTDEAVAYKPLATLGYEMESNCHGRAQYVIGNAHTNTLEGYWAIGVKRMVMGQHFSISAKHIDRYLAGSDFRYNTRFQDVARRFDYFLENCEGRLKYKDLIQKKNG
jgi:transposase-like protein